MNKNKTPHTRRERAAVIALSLLFSLAALVACAALFIRPPELSQQDDGRPTVTEVNVKDVTLPQSEANASDPAPEATGLVRRTDCFMVLVSGLDDGNGGSDTNILVRFDAGNGTIDLVSLPRDTLLNHQWRSNKLNYAYAKGGTELLMSEISNLLGIPVDCYVTVNLRGFICLVDQIGGVDFNVPVSMDYDDPAQDLHIHFSKGMQHLNGQQAMEVVRWRKNNDGTGYANADIGRIATQQAFLTAVAKKAVSLGNVSKLADIFATYVKSDLSVNNFAWFGAEALKIGADNLNFHTLPGDGTAYYRHESVYALDPAATLALVNEALNPYTTDLTLDNMDILVP